MAERDKKSKPAKARELLLDQPIGGPRTIKDFEPLVTALGGGSLDFSAMLAIADLLPMPVGYVDKREVFRFINRAGAEWFERPRREILGHSYAEIVGKDAYAARRALIAEALAGERKFFAADYDHPSRGPLALQIDYVPWADAHGEVRGVIIFAQDVTEQRATERAMKESEERFRRIANSAPALMWVTRLDRSRDFVNEAYADFACGPGCDFEEARTLDWRSRIHPDDVERIVTESVAGEASGKRFTLEGRYRRSDGEYRWLRTVSQPRFGPDGELIGFIGVGTDITLAKEAELELRRQVEEQTRELVLSEARFRGVFDTVLEVLVLMDPDGTVVELNRKQAPWRAANAREAVGRKIWDSPTFEMYPHHKPLMKRAVKQDFNNLLTVVVGGLDIIAKRADDARLKRYADNALAAAERGARLTGQLLAFSRVQRLEVRPTYVAPLIHNMRPLLRNVLGPGIAKEFDLDDSMIPVMADPTQLEVAVLNLAINARDAMPDGGVLTFASRPVEVTDDPELESGEYVELTISDTGLGMPPEVAERAFEPFFTTKEVGKGTGLGLSMVYGMARQSGGAARIESAPGKGTAVKLLFRKAEHDVVEAAVGHDEPASAMVPLAPVSVLVIDDDPDVRSFIAATLEEQGYRVREAADGRGGLAALEREIPDLVVLDFVMPGLSGADVARRILDKHPQQPILFVSGYSETEAVKRAAPEAQLLTKPFRAEVLQNAVRRALAHVS